MIKIFQSNFFVLWKRWILGYFKQWIDKTSNDTIQVFLVCFYLVCHLFMHPHCWHSRQSRG